MDVINCRNCKRLFNSLNNSRICPRCIQQLEDKFQEVKHFLDENPNSTIDTISKENNVTVKQIKQWIREERLSFTDNTVGGIDCEMCGKIIHTGRFCLECKTKISDNLSSAINKPTLDFSEKQRQINARMRFLQNE